MDRARPLTHRIGVFDSGVGGLSILQALHRLRPDAPLHYVADSGHAPYGDRSAEHVVERSLAVTKHLVEEGADLLVVACNTATAYAIDALREHYPDMPMVGVEPGVKPAAARSKSGHIAVMATPGTLASPRFQSLLDRHAPTVEVLRIPCPGLAAAIEQGEEGLAQVLTLLDEYCRPLRDSDVDALVLGCTHYPFVTSEIRERIDTEIQILDTADAVAHQALRLRQTPPKPLAAGTPIVRLESTGDPAVLQRLAREHVWPLCTASQIHI